MLPDSKESRLLRWQDGETPGPWQVVAFPTNRCNLRCGICWQRWVEKKLGALDHSHEMSDDRWLRLVDEAAELGVQEWSIGGGGDPLVRMDLVMRMCARIREQGMNGGIFTNGTLFKKEHLQRLIEIGWERIDFSLDGPTAEINDAIRSEGSFERATANMRLLVDLRRKMGRERPIIDIHTVLTRLNVDKLDAMLDIAAEMAPCQFGVSRLQEQSDLSIQLALTEEQQQALPSLLAHVSERGATMGVTSNARALFFAETGRNAPVRQPVPGWKRTHIMESACFEPWLTATVLPQGYVGPCCAFWDETAETLHKMSLAEAWTGAYLRSLRLRTLAGDLPDYCQWCPSHFIWLTEEIRNRTMALEKQRLESLPAGARLRGRIRRLHVMARLGGWRNVLRRAWEWVLTRLRG